VSTGPNKVRFSHRSWQEFLLAQYFVLCLRWGNVEDFGVTAFNSHIYRMAGECFRGETITDERIGAVLDAWGRSANTYITGNLIAFLAWTQTGIEPRALQRLLDELPRFEALSRVVLIAGLGYRVLVNGPGDASVGDIRRALLPKLRVFSNPETTPVDDVVASSLAWCYQKAFAGLFGMPAPETPWPEIGFSDAETLKALPMVCSRQGDQWLVDTRSRSLQLAFLTPILDALKDPKLAIRAVHYLYYLVAASGGGEKTRRACLGAFARAAAVAGPGVSLRAGDRLLFRGARGVHLVPLVPDPERTARIGIRLRCPQVAR